MTKNTDYINTVFEIPELTKIHGTPTYTSLKKIRDECVANAAQVDSNLGGGNHGLTGLILRDVEYALVSPIPFVRPVHPGPFVIPTGPGITNFHREVARDNHKEQVNLSKEINLVEKQVLKQITKAVPEIYLKGFRDPNTKAINIPVRDLLHNLITTYGTVEDDELQRVHDDLKTKTFDISQPFVAMYNEVEDLKALSIAANNEYTETQLVNLGVRLIRNMAEFERALEDWLATPAANRTWIAFKAHFTLAQKTLMKVRGPTMRNAQMQQTANSITEKVIAEVRDTLAAEKSDMFSKLEETERSIINAVSASSSDETDTESNEPPPQQKINITTNDAVALKILELLQELQKDMKSRNKTPPKKRGGGGGGGGGQRNNGNNNNKKKRRRTNISKYCWSCGAWNHLGKNCRFKKEGHKDEATFENKMGGSTLYCIECNQE